MWNDKNNGRFIVYECTSSGSGLGDRIKGIATTFLIALLTDRAFLINWNYPASIDHILVPNMIDWRVGDLSEYRMLPIFKSYRMNTFEHAINYADVDFDETLTSNHRNASKPSMIITRFNELLPILYSDRYRSKLQRLGLWRMKETDFLGCIFEFLFRPSEQVLVQMKHFYDRNPVLSNSYVIGIQSRIGGGEIGDGTLIPSPRQVWFRDCALELTNNYQVDIHAQQQQQQKYNRVMAEMRPVAWFLTSDSSLFKDLLMDKHNQARSRTPIVQYGKQIRSLDAKQNTASDMVDIMAEYFILQQSNELVISASGFGESAGQITGKKVNHFRHNLHMCQ